jgi:hypothetical protein
MAIIAYNHGAKNLPRLRPSDQAVPFSRFSKLFNPCTPKGWLGWASRNYYAEFLAVLHVEAYRQTFYGDIPSSTIRPVTFYKLPKKKDAFTVAMENGISI